ncbi:MAG: porin [Planctomycetaceae bacterium]|nr:porin [Planctomycetales bacterium]MCB9874446.1 porin [Planctomycetaceae bacterium]MCB9940977.1 porin [Planctomycetaceae bacterium]
MSVDSDAVGRTRCAHIAVTVAFVMGSFCEIHRAEAQPPSNPRFNEPWVDTNSTAIGPGLGAEIPPPISDDTDLWLLSDYELQTHHAKTRHGKSDRYRATFSNPAFHVGGWLQQGLTANYKDPRDRSNGTVLFNNRANDYQLNQFYLYAAKDVRTDQWDWGGRVDVTLGSDSKYVTVPGLEEHQDRSAKWNSDGAQYGLALPQAYFEIGSPLGPYGSSLRVGHFYALGGYETFAAPDNFFYSHSYTYTYGEPFTFSGAMWTGKVSETAALGVAATTGWDSFASDLDEWGLRVGLMKKSLDGRTTLALTGHTGKDFTGITTAAGQMSDPRHWASLVLKHYLTPSLYYVFQSDYGYQENAVVQLDVAMNTVGFDAGQWWGINQYLVYQYNEQWSAGLRLEWFRDQGNSRVSVPVEYQPGGPVFNGGDYYALTAGLNWKPHSNVILRSELRWDFSNVESNPNVPGGVTGVRPFNDRQDDNQLTLAIDAIFLF